MKFLASAPNFRGLADLPHSDPVFPNPGICMRAAGLTVNDGDHHCKLIKASFFSQQLPAITSIEKQTLKD